MRSSSAHAHAPPSPLTPQASDSSATRNRPSRFRARRPPLDGIAPVPGARVADLDLHEVGIELDLEPIGRAAAHRCPARSWRRLARDVPSVLRPRAQLPRPRRRRRRDGARRGNLDLAGIQPGNTWPLPDFPVQTPDMSGFNNRAGRVLRGSSPAGHGGQDRRILVAVGDLGLQAGQEADLPPRRRTR